MTIADGLPGNWINAVHQDSRGFMWFATGSGLVRYDGYDVTLYLHDVKDSTSIASDTVLEVYEDRRGNLWIGTGNGLDLYDPRQDSFSHFRHVPDDTSSLSYNWVIDIVEDRSGNLWVGTQQGLNKFNSATGKFTRYEHDKDDLFSISHDRVEAILEDSSGNLWVGTGQVTGPRQLGGLNRLDPESGMFTRYMHDADKPGSLLDNRVLALHEDSKGRLWVGTDSDGLHLYNPLTDSFTRFQFDPANSASLNTPIPDSETHEQNASPVKDIHEEPDGSLWLAMNQHGLVRFDPDEGSFDLYTHDVKEPYSLNVKSAQNIYKSNDGTLWVGTLSGGINKQSGGIEYYLHDPSPPYDYVFYYPEAIGEDESLNIWLAGVFSLVRWDRQSGTFSYFNSNREAGTPMRSKTLYQDHDGIIWVGTERGLERFDPGSQTFSTFRHDPGRRSSIAPGTVHAIAEDEEGQLWVGTNAGLDKFSRSDKSFEHVQLTQTTDGDSSQEIISSLYLDRRNELWVGTRRGLYVHRPPTRTEDDVALFQLIWPSEHTIRVIHEDSAARFWIGTDKGLYLLDRNTQEIRHFTTLDGMASNRVKAVLEDDSGRLWISTQAGISRFDPNDESFRNLTASEGIPRGFNYGSAVKTRRGELFFGAWNGAISFYPEDLEASHIPPNVVINRIHVLDETLPAQPVDLKHFQNELTFEFIGLHFKDSKRNRYQYRLHSYDREWVDSGRLRVARYTGLPPGDYQFEVRASNSDGVWSTQNASLSFAILPPWWRTAWAYLVYVVFLTGMLVVGFRWQRNIILRRDNARSMRKQVEQAHQIEAMNRQLRFHEQQLENQNQKLLETDELKNRLFANISHEFRTPLTLLLGPLEDVTRKEATAEEFVDQAPLMHRNALRLRHLVNQLLDLSRLDAGDIPIKKTSTDIGLFVRRLVEMFSSRAAKAGIHVTFQGPPAETLTGTIDRDMLQKIVSNLLSNAIKFTFDGGKVTVILAVLHHAEPHAAEPGSVPDSGDSIEIAVKDTGKGIPPDELVNIFDRFYQVDTSSTRHYEGTGIGLALTKELVELQGGSITVESQLGSGSQFIIRLPIGQSESSEDDMLSPDAPHGDLGASLIAVDESSRKTSDSDSFTSDGRDFDEAPLVLIVEDSLDMRSYLSELLKKEGYRTMSARDGIDGVAKAKKIKPSLIISDVMMPEMDGFALCRAVKNDVLLNHIPVVLLTARTEEVDKLEGLKAGADDYLAKPFSAAELRTRTENLIELRRRLRSKYAPGNSFGPGKVSVTSSDEKFLIDVRQIIESKMSRSGFNLEQLAAEVGLSLRQLHRRLKDVSGITPGAYVRMLRLGRAAQLLEQQSGTVSEIGYAVGFKDPDYFSRLFKQVYGTTPSNFRNRLSIGK
ncbi:MAG: response regulator [Rhodothermales bacterium]|nr:response regulator [Rhodothermales bacterium]